jgi:hypothetical protein
VVRTLPSIADLDRTEAHFPFALGSLLVATVLGWVLAIDLGFRILGPLTQWLPSPVSIAAPGVLLAHLTLTVFGFVLATIVGALYQLAPMFTQSKTTGLDEHLAHVEMVGFPIGVVLLATGRLVGSRPIATAGAVLLLVGIAAFAVFFARRLWFARVEADPMLRRYWLVALSLFGWVALSIPRWVGDPMDFYARFGSPRATHLLFVGVVTLTVLGTVYHVVPFIVWSHRYSDRLGYEPVPMVDDLYDDRVALAEFALLAVGLTTLWGGTRSRPWPGSPWSVGTCSTSASCCSPGTGLASSGDTAPRRSGRSSRRWPGDRPVERQYSSVQLPITYYLACY